MGVGSGADGCGPGRPGGQFLECECWTGARAIVRYREARGNFQPQSLSGSSSWNSHTASEQHSRPCYSVHSTLALPMQPIAIEEQRGAHCQTSETRIRLMMWPYACSFIFPIVCPALFGIGPCVDYLPKRMNPRASESRRPTGLLYYVNVSQRARSCVEKRLGRTGNCTRW